MRQALLLGLVLMLPALSGCVTDPPSAGELPRPGEPEAPAITAVATGLDTVWEVAFVDDERFFLTERPGRILTGTIHGGIEADPWAELEVAEVAESGLMGLALHPEFEEAPWVYVCHTYRGQGDALMNRIVRIEAGGGAPGEQEVVLDGMDGNGIHDGCRLGFGPDGLLHATMGDAAHASRAQDEGSLNGKVLRVTATGEIPPGNPSDSPVYTLGHRNPQGLAFHPDNGLPYVTEHGPENHDEVNVLLPGENYGWPMVRGSNDGGGRFQPAIWSSGPDGTVAPAGAAFIQAPGSPLDGAFVFATLKAAELHVLRFEDGAPATVANETVVLDGQFGRLRACVWGPDGALYLGTSNRDGRGQAGATDDRLLRVPLEVLEREVANASQG